MLLAALTEQTGHDGNKLKEHANVREKRVQPREKEVRRERATAAVRWFQPESEAATAASSSLIYFVSLSWVCFCLLVLGLMMVECSDFAVEV
ncbi:hypothetical protein QL285_032990 [Trifolium repens]|jgi:hypothetical protein|nr:hypothetical protein QL285_032990 [Trifolium repens]